MVSKNLGAGCATVDVRTKNRTQRMLIAGTTELDLNMGDSIKCILGTTVAYINPGTPAGAYILTSMLPLQNDGKYVTELVLNEHTTRYIHRGKISVAEDMGNTSRTTGLVVR